MNEKFLSDETLFEPLKSISPLKVPAELWDKILSGIEKHPPLWHERLSLVPLRLVGVAGVVMIAISSIVFYWSKGERVDYNALNNFLYENIVEAEVEDQDPVLGEENYSDFLERDIF